MDTHYRLPVLAMIETMKRSSETLLVQTHLPTLAGISKRACVAHVVLGQGTLHSCTILDEMGRVILHQRAAYEALTRWGDLDWHIVRTPVLAQTSNPRPVRSMTSTLVSKPLPPHTQWPIPVLRQPLIRERLLRLPKLARMALLLVDGKRTVEEIARLLSKTPEEVGCLLGTLDQFIV